VTDLGDDEVFDDGLGHPGPLELGRDAVAEQIKSQHFT
jgi:hypothetical protein